MHAPAYRLRAALGHALIAVSFVLAGSPSIAMAQAGSARASKASEDQHARELFEQGRLAYQEARYEAALDLFMQAYALSKRPQLLNNIGQAADRLRMDSEALDAYQRYLAEVPDAENRPAIENRIAALKAVIESNRTPTVPTPAETARAAEPASDAPARPSPPAATQARDDDGSVLSSWWLWAGIGAAAVAGVLIGVAASGSTETVDGPTPRVDSATRVIEL
jgi:tetratricopeptide (TPR) repeat protein